MDSGLAAARRPGMTNSPMVPEPAYREPVISLDILAPRYAGVDRN